MFKIAIKDRKYNMDYKVFNACSKQAIVGIFLIFSLRIFGMFMIVPVLSTHGIFLKDSNIFLIGLSIGIYGIFQALFQIPYGWLSDKFERKLVIILGLLFFLLGNIIAWSSDSIWGIIIGRGFQGSGAISSVCMALLSDLVPSHNRIKVMGLLGISFGISFFLAIILSPIIVNLFGFYYLFVVNACLAFFCILIVIFFIPTISINKNITIDVESEVRSFFKILKNKYLFRINLSIFLIHFFLMCNFISTPIEFKKVFLNFEDISWILYLLILLISFLCVFLLIIFLKDTIFYSFIAITISICMFILSYIIFLFSYHKYLLLVIGLQIFFIAFTFLETILPALVGKISPVNYKGTAMAIYSTSQFLGSAIGGVLGGVLVENLDFFEISLFECGIACFWLLINIIRITVNVT